MQRTLRPLALGRSPLPLAGRNQATRGPSQPWRPQQQQRSLVVQVAEHTGADTSQEDADPSSSWQGQHPLAPLDVDALTTRLANTTRLAEVLAEQLEQADQVGGPQSYIDRCHGRF